MGNDCNEICCGQDIACCPRQYESKCCESDAWGNRMDDLQNYIFDNSVDMEEMADASTAADHYKTALQGYLDIISEFYQKMTYYKRNLHRAISEKNIEDTNFYYNRINMLEEALQVANITPETIASSTLEWGKAHKSYDTAREISENANRVSIYADGPGICPCK